MATARHDPNLVRYNAPEVAQYYAALNYLTPCEQLLFDNYLKPGMAILDLGVGGGRTTPYLSSIAQRYVGVDYAEKMIAECRQKFPQLEFHLANAADLSQFFSSSFDAVVMAFNGMDYLLPDDARLRALREIHRVLRSEDILIFSSHNARAFFLRPAWNPQRVRALAESIVGSRGILFRPVLWFLMGVRVTVAVLWSVLVSLGRVARRLPTRTFWQGRGYRMDPAHGGLKTHLATPRKVKQEVEQFGFRLLRVVGDDYPRVSRLFCTGWYYYVFRKN
jgi:SAM-dependent methyltransferase